MVDEGIVVEYPYVVHLAIKSCAYTDVVATGIP
jgi:hypothetical protein